MTDSGTLWDLDRFPERLALWRDQERPTPELVAIAEEWIATRRLDPRKGARLERPADNFWFARIPRSMRNGQVAVCSYWIVQAEHLVRCDLFGTVSWPV